jgi:hypothetical protein
VAARLWLLSLRSLWHDEVFTVWISRLSPSEILRALALDSGPPLFYFLEKPVVGLVEAWRLRDQALRSLPFAAIAFLFLAGRRLPSSSRARFLVLAATSPLLLLYSTEARAYGILALLVFVLFRLAAGGAQTSGRVWAIAATAAAAMWIHYLALFAVGSLLLACAAMRRWRVAASLAAGFLLFLPWVPVLATQPAASMGWLHDKQAATAHGFLADLGGGARLLPPFGLPLPGSLLKMAEAAAFVFLVLLLLRRLSDAETRLGLATVLLTLGGVFAVSYSSHPIAVAGRTELAILPVWLWIAARAGETSRAARLAAVAVAAIGVASSLLILAAPRSQRPFADVPDRLLASARPGDVAVGSANFYLPLRLERDRGRLAADLKAFPADLEAHPGWFVARAPAEADYRELAARVSAAGDGESVFLLLDPPYWNRRLQEMMSARGDPSVEKLPYGILVASPAAGR